MRRLLLFSTSTVHGSGYLEYALPFVDSFLGDIDSILFVPYARPGGIGHDRYTEMFAQRMAPAGYQVAGVHRAEDPVAAVADAASVFIGGGNTFVLLQALYRTGIIEPIRERVGDGMPYMGSSAGSNVAGRSIGTTNDMPIVFPPSFEALRLVSFNINPHYLDPDPGSKHMGETRETRIKEFHAFNDQPVIGLREGALLEVEGNSVRLLGGGGARLFRRDRDAVEYAPDAALDMLGGND